MLHAALLCCVFPSQAPAPQPETYASPSGRRKLAIEASARSRARYRMSMDGVELWSEELPFVLEKASVTEDGRAAGYAYAIDRGEQSGELLVILLSPEGRVLARIPHTLENGGSQHGRTVFFPRVEAIALQPELGRFAVCVFASEPPDTELATALWTYDLSTGAPLVRKGLGDDLEGGRVMLLGLCSIPASPLLLLSWSRDDYSREPPRRDAVFQLLDEDVQVVWTLELPHDYELGGDWHAELRLWSELRLKPPILGTLPGRFELRAVAAAQRILFEVEPADAGWRVSELSRIPY